jgi:hypothetical protein
VKEMVRTAKAIEKWHRRAIFIDFHQTRLTGFVEEESHPAGDIPKDFLEKLSKRKPVQKVALRISSMSELFLGMITIVCVLVFIYIEMFSLEVRDSGAKSQLETYAAVSLVVGITVLVTLGTSMIFRRLFPGEVQ